MPSRPRSPFRRACRVTASSTPAEIVRAVCWFTSFSGAMARLRCGWSVESRHEMPRDAPAIRLIFAVLREHALLTQRPEHERGIGDDEHCDIPHRGELARKREMRHQVAC